MSLMHQLDGWTFATAPSGLADVSLNGRSLGANQPIEVGMGADGWGYVVCLIDPITGTQKKQIDGMRRTYTRWGWLALTPAA